MKNYKLRAMLLLTVLLSSVSAFAVVELWRNGLYYRLHDRTAEVIGVGSGVKAVVIPEKITYKIDEYTVTTIGINAFYDCKNLTSVVIPNTVTYIPGGAFMYCSSLASVVIPNSVGSIGGGAFAGCSSLSSVVIPSSVWSIGGGAFASCSSLKKVIIMSVTPPMCDDSGAFWGVNMHECTLYVPEGSINAYKSAQQWNAFYNIETGIKTVPTSASAIEVERYTTGGMRIASPQKGINIIKMSDGTVKKVLVK